MNRLIKNKKIVDKDKNLLTFAKKKITIKFVGTNKEFMCMDYIKTEGILKYVQSVHKIGGGYF